MNRTFSALLSSTAAIASVVLVGLLSSCADIPKQSFVAQQRADPSARTQIKTIGLLSIPNPPFYYIGEGLGMGTALFGLAGAVVETSQAGKESAKYGEFSFADLAQNSLKRHLEEDGFVVKLITVQRPNPNELLSKYDAVDASGVDALLDVAPVMVGFKRNEMTGPLATENGPHVSVATRLVSTNDKRVLYQSSAQYGYDKNPFVGGIRLDAPPDHKFKNSDAVKADMEAAKSQLAYGIDEIAKAIANDIAK